MSKLNLLYIIFFSCIFAYLIPTTSSNNETDFQSLLAFKKAIEHDPQGALVSWNETTHFCSWMGISCGHRHRNRVVAIDLNSGGLTGTVSPHLGNLSFLQSIILQNNSFYGPIPNEIGCLRRLKSVDLSNNSFSGEIPQNLSQCMNIYNLNLIDNKLTGVMPFQLGSLFKLERLGLSLNQFSGTIPPSIGNLTRLVVLSVLSCGLQGEIPESLTRLKSLSFLSIGQNNLSGIVPSGLYNISTMSVFILRSNHLQGNIPSHIDFSSSSLTWIDLGENHFSGGIPIFLSNFSLLQLIQLDGNKFTGGIMIDFSRLLVLEFVVLSYNNLEGDLNFISTMTNCTSLTQFEVNDNLLRGSLPNSIANLTSLQEALDLGMNQLHGSIPSGIGNLLGLTSLVLYGNYLVGPIPSEFGRLNNLHRLSLGANRLTNDIPFSLGNLTLLIILDLSQNRFSGNIPQTLSNCTNLLHFDLSLNNLTGTIPPEIMRLSSISILFNLSHNTLIGPIPSEVGSLVNLGRLDLSHNRLSGSIPGSLSSCLSLEEVYLEENSLHGEIPDALRTLRGVQILDLSRNNLSGEIPRFFVGLNLVYLNLSFNNLDGEVPTLGVFLNQSAFSLQGNTEICGGVLSMHLPHCSSKKSTRKHYSTTLKILVPSISVGAICFIVVACFYINRSKRRVLKGHQSSMPSLEPEFLRVSYADILKATGGFSELNLLGRGSFGSVYKGNLSDGQIPVAVKVLNLTTKGGSRSFMSECNALKSIRHRNLVKVVSICSSTDFQGNDFKALVFEYMENGNLDGWLHLRPEGSNHNDTEERMHFSMKQRISIAMDIAFALEYLHYGTNSTVIHGDLKPSNILLDADMTAHVGDFGLAKVLSDELSTHESSSIGIKGTIGYIPPEYGMSGLVSIEGDVYSYGILLLELFTGRRPTDDEFNDTSSLHDVVRTALPKQVLDVVDPVILQEHNHRIDTNVERCLISVLETGLACTEELPRDRMSMTHVVSALKNALQKVR